MAFRRDWKYVMKYFIGQGCANPGSLSLMQLILYGGASYKWALSMELFFMSLLWRLELCVLVFLNFVDS